MEWGPIILTFKLASITTIILFFIALPIAYWISGTKSRLKPIVETIVSMPLVLPPTVLGFYLLIAFSPNNAVGNFLAENFNLQIAFSFPGLVFASVIYSLPFIVHPIQSGLSSLPDSLKDSAYVLGKSKFQTLTRVLLPNIKKALISGIVLAFAHTIGEFGVVLMIGGNIPDKTRVASIAIYDEVESLDYAAANQYSIILFIICFAILLTVYLINGSKTIKILR